VTRFTRKALTSSEGVYDGICIRHNPEKVPAPVLQPFREKIKNNDSSSSASPLGLLIEGYGLARMRHFSSGRDNFATKSCSGAKTAAGSPPVVGARMLHISSGRDDFAAVNGTTLLVRSLSL
jgi:hypothetical protein